MSHRHTWLYVDAEGKPYTRLHVDATGKPLPIWKRRCKCGVVQIYRAVREKRK